MRQFRVCVLAGLAVLFAGTAMAEAPKTSLRPMPRQGHSSDVSLLPAGLPPSTPTAQAESASGTPQLRPRPRPEVALASLAAPAAPTAVVAAVAPETPRPEARPKGLVAKLAAAIRVKPGESAVVSKKGSVCGIPDIKGQTLAAIPAKINGCGIKDPVKITSVAGVRLKNAATVNCDTAKALRKWITNAVEPVYGKGQVVELTIAASYACRPRNNKRGAKVSEHGRGNAIDISAFTLSNGKSYTVARNYDKKMRKVHKAACGTFGTTLGPGSDGFHEDHLHFDVARHRNGAYCR